MTVNIHLTGRVYIISNNIFNVYDVNINFNEFF